MLTWITKFKPGVIANVYVAFEARPTSPASSLSSSDTEEFRTHKGASTRTNHPVAEAALLHLSQHWRRSISFPDLLAGAQRLAFLGKKTKTKTESRSAKYWCVAS